MWGANGKNHFGAMGNCWLVACLFLPATLVAQDWEAIETYLNDINYDTSVIRRDVGYIRNDMGDVFVLVSDLSDSVDNQTVYVQRIFRFLEDLPTAPDLKYDGTYNDRGIRVVSEGINTRLDKIIELLSSNAVSSAWAFPLTGFDPYGSGLFYGTQFNDYMQWILEKLTLYEQTGDPGWLQQVFAYGGAWRDTPTAMLSQIYKHPSIFVGKAGNNLYSRVVRDLLPYSDASPSTPLNQNYAQIYFREYGTFDLTQMVSNFFYSAIYEDDKHKIVTNDSVLSQLFASRDIPAIFGDVRLSNSVSSVSSLLDQKGLVSTNDSYLGEYSSPSNVSELVDIDTNAWSNSSYSSYVEEFDSESVSNKVSRFDFKTYFSDTFDDAIDSIDVSDVGDFVLEFGNLTLGDWFSYTIPSITISRNDTYLDYVDKFLLGLKAFATCCFFLVLWRQLSEVT